MNVALDGPAGAGKSTIARRLAEELKLIYVDTGAMYRAVGLYFHRLGVPGEDEETISREVSGVDVTIGYENDLQEEYLIGEHVTPYLRTEEASRMSSLVSQYGAVRRKLVGLQQRLAKEHDVVMDGRDIGTVVLPDAGLKIFLTADVKVRAERRRKELLAKGEDCDIAEVEESIRLRDYQDSHRAESPLRKAEDAVVLDTSQMDVDQVVEAITVLYRAREKAGRCGSE